MSASLPTAEVLNTEHGQTIVLPSSIRLPGDKVAVRREGDLVILEPLKPAQWPAGFFDSIRIDDPAFVRPEQGQLPPAPVL
jgi:virulence-associated protein VagC